MAAMDGHMEVDGDTELVGMGLRVSVSPAQTASYIILVMLGILGNAIVVGVIEECNNGPWWGTQLGHHYH